MLDGWRRRGSRLGSTGRLTVIEWIVQAELASVSSGEQQMRAAVQRPGLSARRSLAVEERRPAVWLGRNIFQRRHVLLSVALIVVRHEVFDGVSELGVVACDEGSMHGLGTRLSKLPILQQEVTHPRYSGTHDLVRRSSSRSLRSKSYWHVPRGRCEVRSVQLGDGATARRDFRSSDRGHRRRSEQARVD